MSERDDQLFSQQHQQLTALVGLLEAEQTALVERNSNAIETLARDKQQLLQQIADTDQQLKQVWAEHGADSDIRQELDHLLNHCKALNALNGEVIKLSLTSLGRLQQLMSEARGQGSVTYDGKGKTRPTLGAGRSFEV